MQPSPIIERLSKLPRGQRFVLFVLVYVLVGLVFMFTIYLPGVGEVETLKKNKANLKLQKSQVEARVANKEIFDAELERLTKELKMALKELQYFLVDLPRDEVVESNIIYSIVE